MVKTKVKTPRVKQSREGNSVQVWAVEVTLFQHEMKPEGSTQDEAREEKDGRDCAFANIVKRATLEMSTANGLEVAMFDEVMLWDMHRFSSQWSSSTRCA
jgi:hypothetical protein